MQSAAYGDDKNKNFINRDDEITLIRDRLENLPGKKSLKKTSIVDFFGIEGIGKTRIIQKIADICNEQDLPYIKLDTYRDVATFAPTILEQVTRFTQAKRRKGKRREDDSYTQAIAAIETLLKNKPVVILLDSVDTKNQDTFRWVKSLLYDLIKNNNLLFVLASRQKLIFEQDGSMAHKLTPIQIKPLTYDDSKLYLNSVSDVISDDTKEIICQWTRGYPLAMDVMVHLIQDKHLDIEKNAEHQRKIVPLLIHEVIDKRVLARVEQDLLSWYKAYLSLLSMPRRFNLVIMQRLLEKFEPDRVASTQTILEYIGLPKKLNTNTDILHWDLPKTGFAVDEPVRTIFLLQRRVEEPALFVEVHRFLAAQNQQLISEVSGPDSVRYLREYLYHHTLGYEGASIESFLRVALQQIPYQTTPELVEAITQFKEEFDQDAEFKEILGKSVEIVYSIIDEYLAQ